MELIESIKLRSSSLEEREKAVKIYHELLQFIKDRSLKHIILLRSVLLDTDLEVQMVWENKDIIKGNSILGAQMMDAFSRFGIPYYSLWIKEDEQSRTDCVLARFIKK